MTVRLIGDKSMNKIVSHHRLVMDQIERSTEYHTAISRTRLLSHRRSGNAKVSATYGDTDGFINLDDKVALSIEFGHYTKAKRDGTSTWVPGLHILTTLL